MEITTPSTQPKYLDVFDEVAAQLLNARSDERVSNKSVCPIKQISEIRTAYPEASRIRMLRILKEISDEEGMS